MISQTEFNIMDRIAIFPRTVREIVSASEPSRATVISNLKSLKLKNLVKIDKYGPNRPGRKRFYYSLTNLGRKILTILYKVELNFIVNTLRKKGIKFAFGPSISTWIRTKKIIPKSVDIVIEGKREECKKALKGFSNIKIIKVSTVKRSFYKSYPLLSDQMIKELGTKRQKEALHA